MKVRVVISIGAWFFGLVLMAPAAGPAKGKAQHVVVMVWDGLRPDLVTEQNTPTLYRLSRDGVTFTQHHPVYPSSTEVNGTALATGVFPNRSGIIGNREYRPEINALKSVATESADTIRQGDEISGGQYLGVATVAEILQQTGSRTAVAGTKPVARLADRTENRDSLGARESVNVFSGGALPKSALESIVSTQGVFPAEVNFPNTAEDAWTTRALTETLWKKDVPKYSVLWMSDPDFAQHNTAPGSPIALAALRSCDDQLATVLAALDAKGVRDQTDVFVVSDHGFSTIEQSVDVADLLKKAGFSAAREFPAPPQTGDIVVTGLGGSVFFYVIGHDLAVTRRLVDFLQSSDAAAGDAGFTGVVFTRAALDGTFPLDQVRIHKASAPDVVVAFRWSAHPNKYGIAGSITADSGKRVGNGMHASLSRFDMHNTLIATGPDLRRGARDEWPSGNVDLAPTILWILGVKAPQVMDGRVLFEAMPTVDFDAPKPEETQLEAVRTFEKTQWHQYLRITKFGTSVYFDEGNGERTPR